MKPQRKIVAGGIAGSVSSLVVWALQQFGGIEVPAEQAVAITMLITFAVQYIVPNAPEQPPNA
jgi:hypothetical protein